ncbi:hypothetical protein EIP86_006928 [Pleurotus ostreatoroseus]|nr:hypothetical protein EIP86_006928 [Pleurotus ostreatoroseus]
MAKKKNKQIIRPWCWYCEREFEDEKVLMQHQKAKHFKCNMCPRRLNTAGGLAVHIQQVHKLEPENLPRIENALPGRDGYEVEIFGMEGIPAPDVADYKRRKEIELGLNPGTISQPPNKRPKVENRPLSEEELRAQLAAHRALMGAGEPAPASTPVSESSSAVYGAPPQAYSAPPSIVSPPTVGTPGIPPMLPPGAPPPFVPPGFAGAPPFPPVPGMPMPLPGMIPPPGFPPLSMPPMLPGVIPPPGMPGALPFPPAPGMPFPPPPFLPPGGSPPPPGLTPPIATPTPPVLPPAPSFVPAGSPLTGVPPSTIPPPAPAAPGAQSVPTELKLPNPALAQTNAPFKKPTELKWQDPNFSPEEHRAINPKYYVAKDGKPVQVVEETRGKKRARAEDFL